jgi:hypothetical protein
MGVYTCRPVHTSDLSASRKRGSWTVSFAHLAIPMLNFTIVHLAAQHSKIDSEREGCILALRTGHEHALMPSEQRAFQSMRRSSAEFSEVSGVCVKVSTERVWRVYIQVERAECTASEIIPL